jgi:hypothetical protein
MTETKQEAIGRISELLDKSITLTGKDVGGNGRFTQGSYDPAAEERAAIVAWLRKNAELNPHLPDARALVLHFANAIEDGVHHGKATA